MPEILKTAAAVLYERLSDGELAELLTLLDAEPEQSVEQLRDELHEMNGEEMI